MISQRLIEEREDWTRTPPVNHMTISSSATGLVEGKNQKNVSVSVEFPTGNNPAYDSPRSKSTSGNEVPFTENAKMTNALVLHSGANISSDAEQKKNIRSVFSVRNFDADWRLAMGSRAERKSLPCLANVSNLSCCRATRCPTLPGRWAKAVTADASTAVILDQRILNLCSLCSLEVR